MLYGWVVGHRLLHSGVISKEPSGASLISRDGGLTYFFHLSFPPSEADERIHDPIVL